MTAGEDDGTATGKPVRRFAVEPIETSSTSNRSSRTKVETGSSQNEEKGTNFRPLRKFAIEPIETTSSSNRPSRKGVTEISEPEHTPGRRRFLPQPEETSTRSNRKSKAHVAKDSDTEEEEKLSDSRGSVSKRGPNGERQFVPQLIGTARRSRKFGDGSSSLQPADRTDTSPGDRTYQPRHIRLSRPSLNVPENTPAHSTMHVPQVPESRFSYANLSNKKPEKRKSFRIPALESITSTGDSDDSQDSNPPSLSTSPSAASEEIDVQRKVRVIHKESRDEEDKKISGYILSLAATAAKKQLQEQALAAFPNERQHQPVNHFAIDDESTESEGEDIPNPTQLDDPDFFQRRMSSAGWDLLEMQKHKEMLEEQRRQRRLRDEESRRKKSELDPFSNPYDLSLLRIGRVGIDGEPKSTLGGALRDPVEVTKMRHAASPPMLGADMVFPKSVSPQHTMMDPTQRPVCWKHGKYHGLQSRQNSGLWTPHGTSPAATRKSTATSRHIPEHLPSPGLWGGFCKVPDHMDASSIITSQKSKLQSGLMTPANERADPFSPTTTPISTPYHQLPITPDLNATSDVNLEGIDSVLQLEATIDTEYPDSFVTQVYNYLSLGYPALARDYDSELSKISRVPVEEIRRSDDRVDSKGHIGAPEAEGTWDERKCVEECGRWTALRLYIREWARQQPKFVDETAETRKNARARGGSWVR